MKIILLIRQKLAEEEIYDLKTRLSA